MFDPKKPCQYFGGMNKTTVAMQNGRFYTERGKEIPKDELSNELYCVPKEYHSTQKVEELNELLDQLGEVKIPPPKVKKAPVNKPAPKKGTKKK